MKEILIKTVTIFILVISSFGQLAAQTFEKIIHIPVVSAGVSNIIKDSNDNSYFNIVSNSPSTSGFGLEQKSFFLKLNAIGDSLNLLQITPNDLNTPFNNQTHDLSITLSMFENSTLSHYGSLDLDSNNYVLAKIFTDQNFVVDTVILENQISDTLRNIIGKKGNILYGSKFNLSLGIEFGNIIKETNNSFQETLLFSEYKGMWNGAVESYLQINSNNHYILSTEYSGPPSYFIEGATLSKLDSNFNLIKRERLRVPIRHQNESPNFAFANGSSVLTADTVIFTNFATVNNQDTGKGDLHLFLHDLNLTRLNYKRIVTTDINLSSFVNCTVYDSITSSYYVAVTQTLTVEENHFLRKLKHGCGYLDSMVT